MLYMFIAALKLIYRSDIFETYMSTSTQLILSFKTVKLTKR